MSLCKKLFNFSVLIVAVVKLNGSDGSIIFPFDLHGTEMAPMRKSTTEMQIHCSSPSQRFDLMTQSCHLIGTQGPCHSRMIFKENSNIFGYEDQVYGHCECDQDSFDRPLVPVLGQCHFLYTQAVCAFGYFLVLGSNGRPLCRLNPCHFPQAQTQLVPFQGQCAKLGGPSILCPGDDDIVSFKRGIPEPICVTTTKTPTPKSKRIFRRQITKTNELKCQDGYGRIRGSARCHRLLRIIKSSAR